MRNCVTTPTCRADLYSRAAILDPYPHYERSRDLGSTPRVRRSLWRAAGPCADPIVKADITESDLPRWVSEVVVCP
ncbi:hypothetical protein [Nocardia sp. NPDC052112]|uniref:hypothetical protein n=1 Tax=Nocardia sp. NPDC052112 TaxID=3155646 RepID=UPI003444EE4A